MVSTRLKVKELLRERRWTTKVLAEKTGMSESYLTHIKNGTRRWNEDALRKISEAFEIEPVDLFDHNKGRTDVLNQDIQLPEGFALDNNQQVKVQLKIAPVVGQIPTNPSPFNNQVMQQASGFKDEFVPVIGSEDESIFCLKIEDNGMAPKFVKGDYLIISPSVWTNSGDIVAVEYGNENPVREIMQINFMDEFVVLESVNHKKAPIALVRNKDTFRIIGKVINRYQKM
ncbi:helix-turn-helix transcriptional regulator [Candidatus Dependentiae bacterium]|nr:helix-turn-helix transcriptional regulator [Candidatus Dependentiae bacterium]